MLVRVLLALFLIVPTAAWAADPPAGSKYAVVVGVNQYNHAKLDKLRYAENDAIELAATLKSSGFAVSLLVTGEADGKLGPPSKAAIDEQIVAILGKCRREDIVVIGLAGHGLQFEGEEEAFFCPLDALPQSDDDGRKTLISLNGLYKKLDQSGAGVKLLLVDACRDDPTAGRGASRGIDGSAAPRLPRGTAILFSCSPGERAFEHDNYRHGVFFHHVLEGLRGKARNEEGDVTWDRLVDYVKRHVARDVPKLVKGGAQQSPVHFTGGISGESPILVPPSAAQSVRATLDIFIGDIDKASADQAKLPLKMQALITFVVGGGGGDRMGLRADDVILEVNGREVFGFEQAFHALGEVGAGGLIRLKVQRGDQTLTLSGVHETSYPDAEMFRRVLSAAESSKDPAAWEALGALYFAGSGVQENDAEALKWFRKAADQGNTWSQYLLADMSFTGRGMTADSSEAAKWYRRAADQGLAEAQFAIGNLLLTGNGITTDEEEAVRWYRRSADQGYPMALLAMGYRYEDGRGIEADPQAAVKYYRLAAEQKNTDAMVALGNCYKNGTGVNIDDKESFRWYKKAADAGNSEGQNSVGVFLQSGKGVPDKDEREAVRWFKKSADQNFGWGQYNLANALWYATGVNKDEAKAIELFKKAAEQGNTTAQITLAEHYRSGEGVVKDLKEAFKLMLKAAELDDADAQNRVGDMYATAQGVDKNADEAIKWYRKSAAQQWLPGQANVAWCMLFGFGTAVDLDGAFKNYLAAAELKSDVAENMVGRCYQEGWGVAANTDEAMKWFQRSAEQGNRSAQYNLAYAYYNRNEVRTAAIWFQKSAEGGDPDAQNKLGNMYYHGEGVAKDTRQAVAWYRKAAEQGLARAQNNMGNVHWGGVDGAPQDQKESARWYRLAAEQGYADGQYNLAECFRRGEGEKLNLNEARIWYRKAAAQGHEEAKQELTKLGG